MDYRTSAAALYDGGWRKGDFLQLRSEYGLSEEDSYRIREALCDIEEEEIISEIWELVRRCV